MAAATGLDDPRWDAEMLALHRAMEAAALADPVPDPLADPEGARARTEALNLPLAAGGPAMAESRDLWLPIRGRRMLARLHRPVAPGPGEAPPPVLVYLHGGGWAWNSVDTHDRLARAYAAASGLAVLLPDYALSPEARFPVALEECAAVARWVAARGASALGVDGTRLALGGDSAGANLALGAALRLAGSVPLRGLLLNYGVYAADFDADSYAAFAEGYGLTAARMRAFWDMYAPGPADLADPRCAPLRAGLADLARLPPCLMHAAELDVLAGEGAAMAARLREAGVAVRGRVFPGTPHGFLRAQGRARVAAEAVEDAAGWLREVTA